MYYKLQDSTKNSICGVSLLSNRKMFLSYHQPSYIYGLDTMHVNKTDMAKMGRKIEEGSEEHDGSTRLCGISACVPQYWRSAGHRPA